MIGITKQYPNPNFACLSYYYKMHKLYPNIKALNEMIYSMHFWRILVDLKYRTLMSVWHYDFFKKYCPTQIKMSQTDTQESQKNKTSDKTISGHSSIKQHLLQHCKLIHGVNVQKEVKSCVPVVVGRDCPKENHLIVKNQSICHQISPTLTNQNNTKLMCKISESGIE